MPLIPNWHIDAIADHLQAVTEGQIRNLLINIPPGHGKSLLASVLWPAWVWTIKPKRRSLCCSYAINLAIRDSVKCRSLIDSPWYQELFRPDWRFSDDQNAKGFFENSEKGFRLSLSVGGQNTGYRGDSIIVDDALNAGDQHSKAARSECIFWWDNVMSSRLNNMQLGSKVIIMQRLHEEDLAGHVLKSGGYDHLCLPSEFEPERRAVTSIGWEDPRKEANELLFPELFSREVLDGAKKSLGAYGYAGQHQQRPSPAGGGIFQRDWWKFYTEKPAKFDEVIQSWDCAFKGKESSDPVVGMVIGRVGANKYILDIDKGNRTFTQTLEAIRNVTKKWPEARRKLVEDKANGSAVLDSLKMEIPGLIPVNPEGGKEARAHAISADVEAGNVFLPRDLRWTEEFIDECAAFPNGAHDDQVDAFSQGMMRWVGGAANGVADFYREEARKVTMLRALPPVAENVWVCPACDGNAIVKIGVQFRCNHCGKQWEKDKVVAPVGGMLGAMMGLRV